VDIVGRWVGECRVRTDKVALEWCVRVCGWPINACGHLRTRLPQRCLWSYRLANSNLPDRWSLCPLLATRRAFRKYTCQGIDAWVPALVIASCDDRHCALTLPPLCSLYVFLATPQVPSHNALIYCQIAVSLSSILHTSDDFEQHSGRIRVETGFRDSPVLNWSTHPMQFMLRAGPRLVRIWCSQFTRSTRA